MSGSRIVKIGFSDTHLLAFLEDERIVSTPLAWYPSLMKLSIAELHSYRLIGHGRGLEWESIDLQLSLEGMMQGIPEAGVLPHAQGLTPTN